MAAICYAVAALADKEHAGPADPGLHRPAALRGQPVPIKHRAARPRLHLQLPAVSLRLSASVSASRASGGLALSSNYKKKKTKRKKTAINTPSTKKKKVNLFS